MKQGRLFLLVIVVFTFLQLSIISCVHGYYNVDMNASIRKRACIFKEFSRCALYYYGKKCYQIVASDEFSHIYKRKCVIKAIYDIERERELLDITLAQARSRRASVFNITSLEKSGLCYNQVLGYLRIMKRMLWRFPKFKFNEIDFRYKVYKLERFARQIVKYVSLQIDVSEVVRYYYGREKAEDLMRNVMCLLEKLEALVVENLQVVRNVDLKVILEESFLEFHKTKDMLIDYYEKQLYFVRAL